MTALLVAAALVAAWFGLGLLSAVRDRAGERFARWLLPDGQPWTFRLALAIVRLTEWIAPKSYLRPVWGREDYRGPHGFFERRNLHWHSPAAARAELEADLRAGCSAEAPVALVLPLLREAIRLRVALTALQALALLAFGALMLGAFLAAAVGLAVGGALSRMRRLVRGRGVRDDVPFEYGVIRSAAADAPRAEGSEAPSPPS